MTSGRILVRLYNGLKHRVEYTEFRCVGSVWKNAQWVDEGGAGTSRAFSSGKVKTTDPSKGYTSFVGRDTVMHSEEQEPVASTSMSSIGDPLYALVSMIQKLKQKRTTANELYVRRVLKDQVGLSEQDVETIFDKTNPSIMRRLSVKQNIEPVVLYLRSIGIVGSALVELIVREPMIMCTSVDHLYTIHEWIQRVISRGNSSASRAPAVILQCPQLATKISPEDLDKAAGALDKYPEILETFVWKYPDQFCRFVEDVRDNENLADQYINTLKKNIDSNNNECM